MKVITTLNEKGGVGKTTVAVHIAAGLACRGKRVCLVDGDAQGHAGFALGMAERPALYDLLIRDASWKEVLDRVPLNLDVPLAVGGRDTTRPYGGIGELWLVASNIETQGIPLMLGDGHKLRTRLEQLEHVIDVVVIDTSPTPSLLHTAIYMATDAVIIPTKCETLSFDGVLKSISHMGEMELMGIVPVMVRSGTLEHIENLDALRERYGEKVWSSIPMRTIWTEATTARRPVFVYAPNSEAAMDVWELVDRVEENING